MLVLGTLSLGMCDENGFDLLDSRRRVVGRIGRSDLPDWGEEIAARGGPDPRMLRYLFERALSPAWRRGWNSVIEQEIEGERVLEAIDEGRVCGC